MKLIEMFSPIGAPRSEPQDIDWVGDLKFFIDNDDELLTKHLFPAVEKHKKNIDHPDVHKVYLAPIYKCLESYCKKYNIEDTDEKFPKEKLVELAKRIASEQTKFIEKGDYTE